MASIVRAKGRAEYFLRRHRCTVCSMVWSFIVATSSCTRGAVPLKCEDAPAPVGHWQEGLRVFNCVDKCKNVRRSVVVEWRVTSAAGGFYEACSCSMLAVRWRHR